MLACVFAHILALAPGPARRSDVREEQSLQPQSYQQRVGFAFLTRACPTGCEEDEEPEKGPAVVGDPMFRKEGGEDTHFWLKEGELTPLLSWKGAQGARMVLSGRTFGREDTTNQWFSQFVIQEDGKVVIDANSDSKLLDSESGATIKLTLDGKEVALPTQPQLTKSVYASAKGNVKIYAAKLLKNIGKKSADTLDISADGLKLTVYSSEAHKFEDEADRVEYAHLNLDFGSAIPDGATGIFAQLAGTEPMSAATEELLKERAEAAAVDGVRVALLRHQVGCKCPPPPPLPLAESPPPVPPPLPPPARKASADFTYQFLGGGINHKPLVQDDMVYVALSNGKVYAIRSDGTEEWSHTTSGARIKSSPVMADDKVIFGSFNGQVDALQKDTGDLVWNISTGDVIISSPVVDGETVFIGSEDGKLYALKTEDGEEVWSYATKDKVDSSPAVGDSLVYVGSLDGTVHAINKESGESEWEYETDGVVDNSLAVDDFLVYVGTSEDPTRDPIIPGFLYALGKESGALEWSVEIGGNVTGPAVEGEIVYVGSTNGKVYALKTDGGDLVWEQDVGGNVKDPVVMDDLIIVSRNEHGGDPRAPPPAYSGFQLVALDKESGMIVWRHSLGAWVTRPVAADGVVYAGTGFNNKTLSAIRTLSTSEPDLLTRNYVQLKP